MSTLTELQQVNLAKMASRDAPAPAPADTELRKSVDTEDRKPVSTDAREDARPEASAEATTDASPSVRKPVRSPVRKEMGGLSAAVDAALASREPLTGGVKATVDMSPELSSRAKRYLADHRGQSTRQVLIALFDAFLTEKGY